MIYFVYGNDTTKINNYIRKICTDNVPTYFPGGTMSENDLVNHAGNANLFGNLEVIITDDFIRDSFNDTSPDFLMILKESNNVFIFREDKILAPMVKKLSKFGEVKDFSFKTIKTIPKFNTFSIADGFARRDKVGTWVLYNEAISSGASPEEISGIIFWKIKTMVQNGSRIFTENELKSMSFQLVSLYHKAHRGELDFVIGLEQFILQSLNK